MTDNPTPSIGANQSPAKDVESEHDTVVRAICDASDIEKFTVLNNLGTENNSVAGLFPDIMLQDKKTGALIFIIEVKRNGNIAPCIQQWKNVSRIPGYLYIIVPEADLANAKSIAQVVGLQQAKFGSYKIDPQSKRVTWKYE